MTKTFAGWRLIALYAGLSLIVVLLLLGSGVHPAVAGSRLWEGAFGSPQAWRGTLRQMMPLLFAGLSVFIGLRAGLFNIGAEGQLLIGALATATTALAVQGPLGMVLGLVVGVLAGAIWTLPAGLIKAYRGGHEVITTIMLNNIALLVTGALVAGPLKAPDKQMPTTPMLETQTRMPSLLRLDGTNGTVWTLGSPEDPGVRAMGRLAFEMNLAIPLGVVLILAFGWWLARSVRGYEVCAMGENPVAARFAGVDTRRTTVAALAASGGAAGLGGALLVLGQEGRFFAGFSPGYGFDALGVAILAGSSPVGIVPAAFVFGALNKGALSLQVIDVPKGITGVILGLLIVAFAAARVREARNDD